MATASAPPAPRQGPLALASAWRGYRDAVRAWWRGDGEAVDDVQRVTGFAPSGRAMAYRCAPVPARIPRTR